VAEFLDRGWVEKRTPFVEDDSGVLELICYFEDRSAEPLDVAYRPEALAPSDAELLMEEAEGLELRAEGKKERAVSALSLSP
jgi:hypothetical protein